MSAWERTVRKIPIPNPKKGAIEPNLEEHIREVTPPRDEFIPIRRQPQAPIFENVPIIEVENSGNNPVSPIQLHRRSPDPFGWQH